VTGFPWGQLSCELWLGLLGLVMLGADLLIRDRSKAHYVGYLALVGLMIGLVPAAGGCAPDAASPLLFGGSYAVDRFQVFFRLFALIQAILVVVLSFDYLEHIRLDRGVYFTLIVFGTLAMVLLTGSRDLVMIYLVIEFLSITSYLLAGFLLGSDKPALGEIKRSLEASLKYLIYGAVASAVMVYGFSLMYGLAGATSLEAVGRAYAEPGNALIKLTALIMALAGFTYKISAVPFHQWAPDVYQGAPTPVSAFLAVGSKGAAIAVMVRFLTLATGSFADHWQVVLALVAVCTMFVGNLLALLQSNLKRLLAYSGVAHAGYLLVGLVANDEANRGVQAMLLYLMVYLLMTMGAFAVVVWHQRRTGSEDIADLAGLARTEPFMAIMMTVLLLSLTGIPPTAGFIGKLHLLLLTVNLKHAWLGVMIVINSAISLYYYWNIVRVMWLLPPADEPLAKHRPAQWAAGVAYICGLLTLLAGLQFGPLRDLADAPLDVAPAAMEPAEE